MPTKKDPTAKIWGVYVIDLRPDVWEKKSRRIQPANPGYDPATGKGCVYVGMSQYPPRVRFRHHKSDEPKHRFVASRVVKEFGQRVQRRRSKDFRRNLTEAQAAEREWRTAELLRSRGYAVWPVAAGGRLGGLTARRSRRTT